MPSTHKIRQTPLFVAAALAVLAVASTAIPAAAQTADMKIAIIDVQKIITESATGKAALSQLETYGKSQQDRLKGKNDEINQLRQRISEGQLSLSEDKLAELQADLEEKTIALRRDTDDAQRKFQKEQEKMLQGIESKVMPVIQQLGKDGGYTMIFRKFESGLIYATDTIDITPQVITKIDASG